MNLMQCRLIHLKNTLLGYQKTGISLIEFNGKEFSPCFTEDDIGIYVIIPKIANFFNLSINQAINSFFYALIFIPLLVGTLGFFFYYKSNLQRAIATISLLLLARQACFLGDVYLSYYACVVTIVPWSLYFWKQKKYTDNFLLFSFAVGIIVGFFQYIRAYSGIGTILFFFILFSNYLFSKNNKAIKSICLLALGLALPVLYFNRIHTSSLNYLKSNLSHTVQIQKNHLFWHPVYLGFGFLKTLNSNNIEWSDEFGYKKVNEKNPGITIKNTLEYEEVLKNEVYNLFKNHFQFVLFTIFAKIGIMLFYLVKYANFGLIIALFYRKPWPLELAFWIGMGFYAIFPILAIPIFIEYALGFISVATLYGIVSINYALEHGLLNRFIRRKIV